MATNTGILDLVKPAGNENALISVINSNMDKLDAEAGRSRGNIAANYSTSSAYDVGDLCIYQGNLYRCNTAIASGEEWTAAHWTQVNIAGELDSQKQDIASNTQAIANLDDRIDTLDSVQTPTAPTANSSTVASGTVKCVIKDGWAFISVTNMVFKSAGSSQTIITGCPKAALQVNGKYGGVNATETAAIDAAGDGLWINESGTTILAHLGSTYNKGHWFSVSYPIADS